MLDRLMASPTTGERLAADHLGDQPIDPGLIGGAALGSQLPLPANRIQGAGAVQAEIAAAMLQNVADGNPPFRPELGRVGGVSWFVTEGSPYTAVADDAITLPVEITAPRGASLVEFRERDLLQLFEANLPAARELAEGQFRSDRGLAADQFLNSRARSTIEKNALRVAERSMWQAVGERVASSDSGLGRVVLENSRFSRQGDGVFTLAGNASSVRLQGGTAGLLDVVRAHGVRAEPEVLEAAEKLAQQGKIAGRLEGAFRVGGRVLIVAGLANDAYIIYTADDRVRETVSTVAGWSGAAGGVALYNVATGPTNLAGPFAWAANAVGNITAAGVGYWAGSEVAETVYDLVVDGDPIVVPADR